MAGNYLVVCSPGPSQTVCVIGMANDLSRLTSKVRELNANEALFTRLNVARVARDEVHADLLARYADAKVEVDSV